MNLPDEILRREIDFQKRIAAVLDPCEGDVLYILDACYSSSIAIDNLRETLAASAIEMTSDSRLKGLQSFTQALCSTIRADTSPATVVQIHARLVSEWMDASKGNHLQTTPVHKAAASLETPSIILAPLCADSPPTGLAKPQGQSAAKVLISVTLDDDVPLNLAEWKHWLRTQIPAGVANIEVAGVFESCSKVVLLQLPVAVWDMLPDRRAYSFVGYVRSPNLLI